MLITLILNQIKIPWSEIWKLFRQIPWRKATTLLVRKKFIILKFQDRLNRNSDLYASDHIWTSLLTNHMFLKARYTRKYLLKVFGLLKNAFSSFYSYGMSNRPERKEDNEALAYDNYLNLYMAVCVWCDV